MRDVAVLVLVLAFAAGGALAGVRFEPGDTISSAIEPSGDRDEYLFDAPAGTAFSASLAGEKGGLVPEVALFGPGNLEVPLTGFIRARGNKLQVRKLVLEATGPYRLIISGAEGSTGEYGVKTKAKPPRSFHFAPAVLSPGETLDFTAWGMDGARLGVSIKTGKGSPVKVVSVYGPAGEAPGGLAAFDPGGSARKAVVSLFDGFGVYGLVLGGAVADEAVTVKMKVSPPKAAKASLRISAAEPRPGVVDPASGPAKIQVKITGSGFAPGVRVFFGETEADPVDLRSSGELRVPAPSGAPTGVPLDLLVRGADGQENVLPDAFTILVPPVAYGVAPTEADPGQVVTISGSGFQAGAAVRFDFVASDLVTWVSSWEVRARIPLAGYPEGRVDVVVTNPDGLFSRLANALLIEPDPEVTDVDPTEGEAGETVTITGDRFREGSVVDFGGEPAATTYVSGTTLTAVVPAGASPGVVDVTVTKPFGSAGTLETAFTVLETVPVFEGLLITGIIDGPRSGGLPKALELHATVDIPDLSAYSLGAASNGAAFSGGTYALSGSASAGDYLYVATESSEFATYFGFAPDFVSSVLNVNGNDAVALYESGVPIDAFGDPADVSGSADLSASWVYQDSYAYRQDTTFPAYPFVEANWTVLPPDTLDAQGASGANGDSGVTVPFGTWSAK